MTEDKARLTRIIEALNRSWLDGRYNDIGQFVHEAVVISPPGNAPLTGRDAFVQSFTDFGTAATVHGFHSDEARIATWGATAVAECPFTIDYEIPSGRFKEKGVDLLIFTRTDDKWLICWRTMSSAPANDGP